MYNKSPMSEIHLRLITATKSHGTRNAWDINVMCTVVSIHQMKDLLRLCIGHFSVEGMNQSNAIIKESSESKGSLKLKCRVM
jgi:hypothetical protein